MPVLTLGVSFRSAPVELLERLAIPEDDMDKAFERLRNLPAVHGAVLVSTCNRVEVTASVDGYHGGFQDLKRFLAESREVPMDELAGPLYSHYEEQAAEHLFEVAAGLDSMVVGEPQILSQVRQSVRRAVEADASDPLLDGLFRHAVRVGRRVRAETAVGTSADAFVAAGLQVARDAIGVPDRVLVLGAGQMGSLAVQALQGTTEITVLSRRQENAFALAQTVAGTSGDLDDLERALEHADLVVCSTDATGTVIGPDVVEQVMAHRTDPLFFLDLAVPRDVDPAVGDIRGVTVANVDDLGRATGGTDQDLLAAARHLIKEEVVAFGRWRRNAEVAPLITALHERADSIRRAEVAKLKGSMTDEELGAVDGAIRAAMNKLLHHPVVHAKRSETDSEAVRKLFDL